MHIFALYATDTIKGAVFLGTADSNKTACRNKCLFLLQYVQNQHEWAGLLSFSLINQQTEPETEKHSWYGWLVHVDPAMTRCSSQDFWQEWK